LFVSCAGLKELLRIKKMKEAFASKCSCRICSSLMSKQFTVFDDRYGYPGFFFLFRCPSCYHVSLDAKFTNDELTDLYSTYYPRALLDVDSPNKIDNMNGFSSWFDGLSGKAFRWIPRNVKVLDIGCGFGQTIRYHLARGCDAYGVEADKNIERVIQKYGYKIHVGLFDPNIYEKNTFDYITLDQVIEHVRDPLVTLKGIAKILKSGGSVVLSTPNSQGWGAKLFRRSWINWHTPYHLHFFSVRSMQAAAKKAGLTLDKTLTITSSEWLHYQWVHLVTFPKPGSPSKFWAQSISLTYSQKILIRALNLMHRLKINHIITRFFDALNLGDSRLYILRKE